jgi:ElaB/YqjD/DUF883 family membrane-anchored ribosome-binding protein
MSTPTSYAESDTASSASAFTDKAKDMGARAKAVVSEQVGALADRVRPQVDAVNDYVRNEPTKALLIAAATGAGLMALIALASNRSSGPRVPNVDTGDLAAAIREFTKRGPQAANDVLDDGKKKASAAADVLSDAWDQLRDQAGPMVDKIRPQIDAVTAFAKDDPVKAAAGLALAGAVLAGVVALIRGRMDD